MILPAVTSSAPCRAAGILAARKKSLRRRISHQRALYCQTAARIMLRLQDEEWRAGDSDREREASQHTPNQAHVKHDLSTSSQSSLPSPSPRTGSASLSPATLPQ